MPLADRTAANNDVYGSMYSTNTFAAFVAETLGPDDHHLRSEAKGKCVRWCTDSGAFYHMTNCKEDLYNFRHAPKMWVKCMCAYTEDVGDVNINLRDLAG